METVNNHRAMTALFVFVRRAWGKLKPVIKPRFTRSQNDVSEELPVHARLLTGIDHRLNTR